VYLAATGDFSFGDVFSADWMFDIHVRGDAVPLKPFECHMGKGRPKILGYQPAIPKPQRDLVLSHGKRHRAVLLSDNCEVESVIVRRRAGRLTFAAVEDWPKNATEAERAVQSQAFRRHPLPPADGFTGGIVNLGSLFAVGWDAVASATPDPRVARLDDDCVIDLEIRWNAYATRRGPRAHTDNALKLAMLLTADGNPAILAALRDLDNPARLKPDSLDQAAANAVARALTIGWTLEGGVMNNMADALENGDPAGPSRDEILAQLIELRDAAETAHRALTATKDVDTQDGGVQDPT
jgi:hypothetical protein